MKVIGLIGGMSWESSAVYYDIINKTVKEKLGGHHSCKCLMYSVDFAVIEKLQHEGNWKQLTQIMIDAAQRLERGGAELLVIATNTMHKIAPEVEKSVRIPLIHIVDAVAEKIRAQGLSKAALLGTRYTMEQEFYKGRLTEKHGIEVIIPDLPGIEMVHRIIYRELVMGVIREESRQECIRIIQKLIDRGAEGIILGCTEIPLLVKQADCAVPVFDTTTIHAERAVEIALG
ncbi:MAG: aspartate/glutamate racemase family protein [Porphyromonadaceae bacterium]|nr:MAG: aspartate/glutamate racemase family protein [Porphyromonadaceae bacterium]